MHLEKLYTSGLILKCHWFKTDLLAPIESVTMVFSKLYWFSAQNPISRCGGQAKAGPAE